MTKADVDSGELEPLDTLLLFARELSKQLDSTSAIMAGLMRELGQAMKSQAILELTDRNQQRDIDSLIVSINGVEGRSDTGLMSRIHVLEIMLKSIDDRLTKQTAADHEILRAGAVGKWALIGAIATAVIAFIGSIIMSYLKR